MDHDDHGGSDYDSSVLTRKCHDHDDQGGSDYDSSVLIGKYHGS
jgi:hypothetical protein